MEPEFTLDDLDQWIEQAHLDGSFKASLRLISRMLRSMQPEPPKEGCEITRLQQDARTLRVAYEESLRRNDQLTKQLETMKGNYVALRKAVEASLQEN